MMDFKLDFFNCDHLRVKNVSGSIFHNLSPIWMIQAYELIKPILKNNWFDVKEIFQIADYDLLIFRTSDNIISKGLIIQIEGYLYTLEDNSFKEDKFIFNSAKNIYFKPIKKKIIF